MADKYPDRVELIQWNTDNSADMEISMSGGIIPFRLKYIKFRSPLVSITIYNVMNGNPVYVSAQASLILAILLSQ
jgi:hypothetical protein